MQVLEDEGNNVWLVGQDRHKLLTALDKVIRSGRVIRGEEFA
jgi:hypothetical protein